VAIPTLASKSKVVAGIPAYNEEKSIAKIVLRTRRLADSVIVVDDGSTDDTAMIAEGLGAKVIKHERNLGYGAAIRSCFDAARDLKADVLVTIDADGQHDPGQIARLIDPIKDGSADLVLGSRFMRDAGDRQPPRYRRAGIMLLTRFTEAASGAQFSDAQSGFRAYSRKALEQIRPTEQGMGVSVEILMKAAEHGLRTVEVPVTIKYGDLKTSTHNPLYHALDVAASLIKFTSIRHPLLFYGILAAAALVVSFGFGLWAVDIYAKEGRLVTNVALISIASGLVGIFALFTGIILFAMISVVREKT
jgi:glycosyltransferase involved in cell wall biosynthesis